MGRIINSTVPPNNYHLNNYFIHWISHYAFGKVVIMVVMMMVVVVVMMMMMVVVVVMMMVVVVVACLGAFCVQWRL